MCKCRNVRLRPIQRHPTKCRHALTTRTEACRTGTVDSFFGGGARYGVVLTCGRVALSFWIQSRDDMPSVTNMHPKPSSTTHRQPSQMCRAHIPVRVKEETFSWCTQALSIRVGHARCTNVQSVSLRRFMCVFSIPTGANSVLTRVLHSNR